MADYAMVTLLRYLFPLMVTVASAQSSDYKIVCYYNYWSNYYTSDGKFQVEYIDPFLCTHLVYAYVGINSCSDVLILDPHLQGGDSYRGREDFKRFIALKKNNTELKCLVAFGGYNGDHVRFSTIIRNSVEREKFISNVITFMDDYCLDDDTCFDGVSLDYYYPRSEFDGDDYNYFVQLLVDMRSTFTDHYGEGVYKLIAVAASAIGTKIEDYYNIPEIAEKADFVSLVTYDYYGPTWSNDKTGFVAPLYGRNGHDILNQNSTVHAWLNKQLGPVHRKKLLLGMPTYGRSFNLTNKSMTNVGDPTRGAATIGPYTNTPGFFTYNELVNTIFRNNQNWNETWDDVQKVPYAYKDNIWISYENEETFAIKAYYIKHKANLGGAMINSIDADDFKRNYSLIRAVKNILFGDDTGPPTSNPIPPSTPSTVPSTTPPTTTSTSSSTVPSTFTCKKKGLFINPHNCTEYYVCEPQPDGSFRKFKQYCPEDLAFDERECYCNWRYLVAACKSTDGNVSEGCVYSGSFRRFRRFG